MKIGNQLAVNTYRNQGFLKNSCSSCSGDKSSQQISFENSDALNVEKEKSPRKEDKDSVEISDQAKKAQQELSQEDLVLVRKLENRDAEVRAHEQAHLSAAGGIAMGSASFSYETGPDGNKYAVGGEVSIDTSDEGDPQATIQKMRRVRAAALAPASPSSTDRSVASMASQKMVQAQQELNTEPKEKDGEEEKESSSEKTKESAEPSEKNSKKDQPIPFENKNAIQSYTKTQNQPNSDYIKYFAFG